MDFIISFALPAFLALLTAHGIGVERERRRKNEPRVVHVVVQRQLPPPRQTIPGTTGPCCRCGRRLVRDVAEWCAECQHEVRIAPFIDQ